MFGIKIHLTIQLTVRLKTSAKMHLTWTTIMKDSVLGKTGFESGFHQNGQLSFLYLVTYF